MVPSTALSKLSDYELHYIEKTLSEKLTQQHDLNKTWSGPKGAAGISVALDPDSVYAPELQAEVDEMRDLLGRVHNQKVWYTPKDGRFQGGG